VRVLNVQVVQQLHSVQIVNRPLPIQKFKVPSFKGLSLTRSWPARFNLVPFFSAKLLPAFSHGACAGRFHDSQVCQVQRFARRSLACIEHFDGDDALVFCVVMTTPSISTESSMGTLARNSMFNRSCAASYSIFMALCPSSNDGGITPAGAEPTQENLRLAAFKTAQALE
jgi:hypothetical protein